MFKIISLICLSLLLLVCAQVMDEEEKETLLLAKLSFLLVLFIPLIYIATH